MASPVSVDETIVIELEIQPPEMMFEEKLATFSALEYTLTKVQTKITFNRQGVTHEGFGCWWRRLHW